MSLKRKNKVVLNKINNEMWANGYARLNPDFEIFFNKVKNTITLCKLAPGKSFRKKKHIPNAKWIPFWLDQLITFILHYHNDTIGKPALIYKLLEYLVVGEDNQNIIFLLFKLNEGNGGELVLSFLQLDYGSQTLEPSPVESLPYVRT